MNYPAASDGVVDPSYAIKDSVLQMVIHISSTVSRLMSKYPSGERWKKENCPFYIA